ncbi:WSCD family member AAEL009094 isoform X1 [Centruroides vittatus]|uniref:WSCD family member AAEL009094-like isoform X1 n=1 Tax=Centruroides sculpturatus TaxID=218467 RepID=UPI000C6EB7B6|nr:WSCD family member AAEL009094-like isoform X1 [Centruroides sculpturatus]
MGGERTLLDRRTNRTKNFRRVACCMIATVLSSYLILFVVVVSRQLDHNAEQELQRSAQAAYLGKTGKTDSNLLDRQPDRKAIVARMLASGGLVPLTSRRAVKVCSKAKFRVPPGPLVALASFPGSGNTWLRFLIQQASGYLTGSVYKDYALMRNGFPAESISNGSVVLIKTHEWGPAARKKYDKAILLIREPYGALLAEFNRRAGGHLGHASPEKFRRGKVWRNYVAIQTKAWMNTVLDWLNFEGPLHIIRYEYFVQNLSSELSKVMKFLNITVPWSTFQCVLRNRDGIFRRSKKELKFEPFDASMRRTIDRYNDIVKKAIKLHFQGVRVDLEHLTTQNRTDFDRNETIFVTT